MSTPTRPNHARANSGSNFFSLKLASLLFTAPSLVPSIPTSCAPKSFIWWHSPMNSRLTPRSERRLSLRKSAMVLKSGRSWRISQSTSTLR